MFDQELKDIRSVEQQADDIVQKAEADGKDLIAESKRKADQILADAESKAAAIYDSLIREGTETAQKNYDASMQTAQQKCQAIADSAAAHSDEAVRLIKERIVNRKWQS